MLLRQTIQFRCEQVKEDEILQWLEAGAGQQLWLNHGRTTVDALVAPNEILSLHFFHTKGHTMKFGNFKLGSSQRRR